MTKIVVIGMLALTLSACASAREERLVTGAGIGAAAGAIVGGAATGTGTGAVVGGAIGAVGGAAIADTTGPRRGKRCHYSQRWERTVCR